jgi:hypothetical protein
MRSLILLMAIPLLSSCGTSGGALPPQDTALLETHSDGSPQDSTPSDGESADAPDLATDGGGVDADLQTDVGPGSVQR